MSQVVGGYPLKVDIREVTQKLNMLIEEHNNSSALMSVEQETKTEDECTPGNCPFAPTQNGLGKAWGMGPEGWAAAMKRHQDHCKHQKRCPDCGKEL